MSEATPTESTQRAREPRLYGYLVEFHDPDALLRAAGLVRDAGYKRWDCYTPFPVHGLDKAMNIRPTILPWMVMGAGLAGCAAGLLLQIITNSHWYPFIVGGKPYYSIPAFIPVTFELTILFSAVTTVFGMLGLNRLPRLHHPLFTSPRFREVTTDRFCLCIEATDPSFDPKMTRALLESLGGSDVEEVYD